MPEKKVPFPSVPSSYWLTIFFSLTLLTTLYFLSEGGQRPADPVFLYLTLATLLIVLGISVPGFKGVRKVLGFEEPFPGTNLFLAILGVGIGMLVIGIATKPLTLLFAGNARAISLVQPLYVATNVEPYMFTLPSAITKTLFGSVLFFLVVATGESVFHIICLKNLVNSIYLSRFGDKMPFALIVFMAYVASGMLFSSWHTFSWGREIALGIIGMASALFYLTIFYSTYLIPDLLGIFTPKTPIAFKKVLLMGVITSHAFYDVGVTTDLPLTGIEMAGLGLGLVILSLVGMWISKWISSQEYFVSPF